MILEWIPITYRTMDEEEKKEYADRTGHDVEKLNVILNCPLPEDGQDVLITGRFGNVDVDTFFNDCDGCYFECNSDMYDVIAWMPMPTPYQKEQK